MSQWSVRMRVERIEYWTVEAESEEEAFRRAHDCDTEDERQVEIVNWDALSAKEDK